MKSIPFWKVNSERGAAMRETNVTLDGQSTRLIARSFSTATEAQHWIGSPFTIEPF
jgi:hypothetical protein